MMLSFVCSSACGVVVSSGFVVLSSGCGFLVGNISVVVPSVYSIQVKNCLEM